MTSNDNKFYLGYLNRLVDGYSNTYHRSIGKKPSVVDYFALTEEIKTDPQASKLESGDRVRITEYKNIFSKDCAKNWSREIFIIDSVFKTNSWTYKIKDLNRKKIKGSFYEK